MAESQTDDLTSQDKAVNRSPASVSGASENGQVRAIKLTELTPAPWNARKEFDEEELAGLADALLELGQLQPILVRPTKSGPAKYEIVAGERRFRAAKLAGLETLNATVDDFDDDTARKKSLGENLGRDELNPWEQLHGILDYLALELKHYPGWPSLVADKGSDTLAAAWVINVSGRVHPQPSPAALTALDVANPNELPRILDRVLQTGKTISITTVRAKRLPLLSMPKDLQEALATGRLKYSESQLLRRVGDDDKRRELLERVVNKELDTNELSTEVTKARTSKADAAPSFADQLRERLTGVNRLLKHADTLSARDKQRLEKALSDVEKWLGIPEQPSPE